jgi:hypothetical protein
MMGLGPRARRLPDALLDDLTIDPARSTSAQEDRPDSARITLNVGPGLVSIDGMTPVPTPTNGPALPAGPMGRRGSSDRSARLAELLLAIGLCGFGAGFHANRHRSAGEVRSPEATRDGRPPSTEPWGGRPHRR